MAHTLFEQEYAVDKGNNTAYKFITEIMIIEGIRNSTTSNHYLNGNNGINFQTYFQTSSSISNSNICLALNSKSNIAINTVNNGNCDGVIYYHISEGETVKYFKYIQKSETGKSYTYILAEDNNGEWVVLNGDKMYSNYKGGIYNNFFNGSHSEIIDSNNMFIISEASRFDTGVKFKELYYVLSSKAYSDSNCLVTFNDKVYRLVSVSNDKDESGRYPAFAFPVSEGE